MAAAGNPGMSGFDWSTIPAPVDDGAMRHLAGARVPDVALPSTAGGTVSLGRLKGRTVVFAYPRTGQPGQPSLLPDWDMIPGARGCTPQACSFRDLYRDLTGAGCDAVLGLSTQDTAFQREAAERLALPYPILSDEKLALASAMRLPTMPAGAVTLLKRFALVIDDGVVRQVFYPVFPPDRNAADVLDWVKANPR